MAYCSSAALTSANSLFDPAPAAAVDGAQSAASFFDLGAPSATTESPLFSIGETPVTAPPTSGELIFDTPSTGAGSLFGSGTEPGVVAEESSDK